MQQRKSRHSPLTIILCVAAISYSRNVSTDAYGDLTKTNQHGGEMLYMNPISYMGFKLKKESVHNKDDDLRCPCACVPV